MRSIPEQRIAEFQEQDYQLYFGISKLEFDRMLKALHEAYRQEHKRKTRFTKISMMDKLIMYRNMGLCAQSGYLYRKTEVKPQKNRS